jgi:hypothetical protein
MIFTKRVSNKINDIMKRMFFLTAIVAVFGISTVAAQQSKSYYSSDYTTAIGIKFYPGSLTIKHFVNDGAAVEGLAYFWNHGLRVTGLYEVHNDINSVEGLKWYYGGGAHLGFYDKKYGGGSSIGIDGVLGLDYKFTDVPINLSLDWQPSFEFTGGNYNGFNGNWGGLGIRYTL